MAKKILIVDDSALVRKQLGELLSGAGYECEFARNGAEGVEKVLEGSYDAVTMDINMPVMDGLSAVKAIMEQKPTPIIMVSSLTTEDAGVTVDALEYGAIDFVAKPGTFNIDPRQNGEEILSKVRTASVVSVARLKGRSQLRLSKLEAGAKQEESPKTKSIQLSSAAGGATIANVVLIGSSTGGPRLIEEICASLPQDYPNAVCVVQHMPEKFTAAFASRLNNVSRLLVKESEHNEELLPGVVYIAKGGTHLHFAKKVSGRIVLRHGSADKKRFFMPSVDEMFFSAVEVVTPKKLVAVELTGIGDDGADGMVAIKKAGGYTIAESEETAIVFGMPKEAALRGGASEVLPFPKILRALCSIR